MNSSTLEQAPAPTRAWSAQQRAIFDWFATGSGHLVVRARAGTGKTTTIIEAISHAPERNILLAAFNKRIAEELQHRLTNPNAQAKTLHAIGFACVRRYWEGLSIAHGNDRAFALADAVCGSQAPDVIKRLVAKLHSKGREILPHASQLGDLTDIAITFECEPDETWVKDGFDLDFIEARALEAMALAAKDKPVQTGIDFADMIFLPVRNHWLRREYDLVVVDEAQDMTVAQLEIAQGVSSGRIAVVGDDRQAIYAFRGADAGSLDRLKMQLQATELGLTVTYRCGRLITETAARLVPDFQAGPSNPSGSIRLMRIDAMVVESKPGDFVLSRKNAPLASVAMALIRAQKRVRIAGRDIGAGLIAIVKKLAKGSAANSIPEFLEKLTAWEEREIYRAVKMGREERADTVRDQAETLRVLTESVASVRELETRIDSLFTDNGLGDKGFITCSSVHKAKGLEADRVYILKDTLNPVLPKGVKAMPGRAIEEANIEYVAITRAKNELVWVSENLPTPSAVDQTVR
jgi:DNA helicase-2/ATP-dependent DNA helicase PcrA